VAGLASAAQPDAKKPNFIFIFAALLSQILITILADSSNARQKAFDNQYAYLQLLF
jgi:hypothetical protein